MENKLTRHTPTPWVAEADYSIVDECGFEVAYIETSKQHKSDGEAEANAAFIVRAVNAHEELLEVLKDVQYFLNTGTQPSNLAVIVDKAIARAEGR